MTPNDIISRGLKNQRLKIKGEGEFEIKDAWLFHDDKTVGVDILLENNKRIFVHANEHLDGVFVA